MIFFDSIECAAILCAIHGYKVFVSALAYEAAGIYGKRKAIVLAMWDYSGKRGDLLMRHQERGSASIHAAGDKKRRMRYQIMHDMY